MSNPNVNPLMADVEVLSPMSSDLRVRVFLPIAIKTVNLWVDVLSPMSSDLRKFLMGCDPDMFSSARAAFLAVHSFFACGFRMLRAGPWKGIGLWVWCKQPLLECRWSWTYVLNVLCPEWRVRLIFHCRVSNCYVIGSTFQMLKSVMWPLKWNQPEPVCFLRWRAASECLAGILGRELDWTSRDFIK